MTITLIHLNRRAAFTLIELLVVISIISILAAILFPVFGRAREKARQTTCASNLKQIGLAFTQYEQDFDDYFPCDSSDPYLWQGRHFRWLIMPYLGIGQRKSSETAYTATSSNAMILQCPSDPSKSFDNTSYAYSIAFYHTVAQLQGMGKTLKDNYYSLTGSPPSPFPYPPTPQAVGAVNFPAQKVLCGEWTDNHDGIQPPLSWWTAISQANGTHYEDLFVDGHVKYMPTGKMTIGYDGFLDPNATIGGIGGQDFTSG